MINHNILIQGLLGIVALLVCAIVFVIGVYLNKPDVYYPFLIIAVVVVLRLNFITDKFIKK